MPSMGRSTRCPASRRSRTLGSIVEALRFGPRDSELEPDKLRADFHRTGKRFASGYVAFESDIRAGASEVYVHGMPGGQYTNLQ